MRNYSMRDLFVAMLVFMVLVFNIFPAAAMADDAKMAVRLWEEVKKARKELPVYAATMVAVKSGKLNRLMPAGVVDLARGLDSGQIEYRSIIGHAYVKVERHGSIVTFSVSADYSENLGGREKYLMVGGETWTTVRYLIEMSRDGIVFLKEEDGTINTAPATWSTYVAMRPLSLVMHELFKEDELMVLGLRAREKKSRISEKDLSSVISFWGEDGILTYDQVMAWKKRAKGPVDKILIAAQPGFGLIKRDAEGTFRLLRKGQW